MDSKNLAVGRPVGPTIVDLSDRNSQGAVQPNELHASSREGASPRISSFTPGLAPLTSYLLWTRRAQIVPCTCPRHSRSPLPGKCAGCHNDAAQRRRLAQYAGPDAQHCSATTRRCNGINAITHKQIHAIDSLVGTISMDNLEMPDTASMCYHDAEVWLERHSRA